MAVTGAGLAERAAEAFAASVPEQPADDGFFGPGSVTWKLAGHMTMPVVAIRALLLQALHPLAMAGVDQHSDWRADPGARLASTSAYVATISYGDRATATKAAERVKRIHESVRGTDPATGKPYSATDPTLLVWVHNALTDSQLAGVRAFGAISEPEADRYVAEQVAAAELIGIPPERAPTTTRALAAYFDEVRPDLACTPAAAEAMTYLLEYIAADADAGEIWREIADAAIATLPGWAIALYAGKVEGLRTGPFRSGEMSAEARTAVRQALGVLDAVFLAEPGVLEARQRLQLRIRHAEARS